MPGPPAVRVLALLLCLLPATASAQYHITAFTVEQGLPAGTVTAANQTPDGFVWAATLGGLVRFDGAGLRVFDTVSNPELPSSRIGGVIVDGEGQLWVVTENADLMRFRDGRFIASGAADGLPAGRLGPIKIDRGRLLITMATGESVIRQNGRFVPFINPVPAGAAGMTFISNVMGGATSQVRWYRDAGAIAHRFDGDRITRSLALPAGNIYEDRKGRIWMASRGDLLCFEGGGVRRYSRQDGLIGVEILWILEDPDGTLWFAEPQGLARFRDGHFTSYTKADGLPDNNVRSIFRDREGTYWVCTFGGIARLTEQPIVSYTTSHGLAANNTYPILEDRRGDIWIGGWNGLTRYRNGTFENVTMKYRIDRLNVVSLMQDRDGAVWVGTMGGGIRRITDQGFTLVLPEGPASGTVYVMYQTRNGDVWLGRDEGALRYHDGVLDPYIPVGVLVSTFFEDDRGVLWIGHADGLSRYERGVVTRVGEKDGFGGRGVRAIRPDPAGGLWIGTYDSGLFRYRDGRYTRFTTLEGLPANGAFEILEDDQARFWISSNAGIYRVSKAELEEIAAGGRRRVTAVRYGREDGMANQECNGVGRPAGIRAADGRLWFPTPGGVAVISPAAVIARSAPPVAILDVTASGDPVALRDRVEIGAGSIPSFDARYTALTFVRPELVQFKYRMEGVDSDWIDAGTVRSAHYGRLPYGRFRFRVIAANRDGVWNEEGASIAVIVVPPFWKTTWFMWLMAGAVMAAGFGTHRVRLGVLERKRALQEAFARQLIDSQETDRRRIASELHDGVSQTLVVIRNWSQMSGQSLPEDMARKKLGDISNAASQAIGEVREVVQDLVPYHLERVGLSEAMREAAARVADSSGIAITCTCADLNGALSTETSLRLFRVAQEGLNNVVKHSGATSASIDVSLEPGLVRLAIQDNGKGFVPEAVKPTAAGDGFGLVGMAERARMMAGDIVIDSAPGKGTTITIVVPAAGVYCR